MFLRMHQFLPEVYKIIQLNRFPPASIKKKFEWSPQAEQAFARLKVLFISAPILILPDPTKQLIVKDLIKTTSSILAPSSLAA